MAARPGPQAHGARITDDALFGTACCAAARSAWARPTWTACGRRTTSRPSSASASSTAVSAGLGRRANEVAHLPSRRLHLSRRNSLDGSRKNIHDHYDLSNDLFALFLDETMGTAAPSTSTPDQDLAQAQRNKYEALCRKADIGPNDRVLEIGCGWGGFAMHAAAELRLLG